MESFDRLKQMGRQQLLTTSEKDYTLVHSEQVARIAEIFAERLGLDPNSAYDCGLFHDVGKTQEPVCEVLISASGRKLTPTENVIKELHPILSYQTLLEWQEIIRKDDPNFSIPEIILMCALFHHLWYDNGQNGYPREQTYRQMYEKLSQKDKRMIRLISMADVTDAIFGRFFRKDMDRVNDSYSNHASVDEIFQELIGENVCGRQLDPFFIGMMVGGIGSDVQACYRM